MTITRITSIFLTLILILAASSVTISAKNSDNDSLSSDYKKELIAHFAKKGSNIAPLLEDSRFKLYDKITKKFTKSAEARIPTLEEYKVAIGFARKKDDIPKFIEQYRTELEYAEKEYGIPKSVIVGILGIESHYGKYSGSYNPFNAYVSMYAEGHRAKFALAQLEELLKFADRNKLDVFEMKSSYAGAMSYAQFIPWSLNRWFVGDELYNMSNNIYSVANYLAHFKKITGTVEKAVYRYNPSDLYVGAVLALADEASIVF
ncbi:MAG: lytic murein transglycosylase [Balneolaceae bacterium]